MSEKPTTKDHSPVTIPTWRHVELMGKEDRLQAYQELVEELRERLSFMRRMARSTQEQEFFTACYEALKLITDFQEQK